MELKGSKTEKNLLAAFAGESQAYMKYGFYAAQAKKDGFNSVGEIFADTAANEQAHAKLWMLALHGGAVPPTLSNLADAAAGEHFEWTEMYAAFAKTAREEGFDGIAAQMEGVAQIEDRGSRTLPEVAVLVEDTVVRQVALVVAVKYLAA